MNTTNEKPGTPMEQIYFTIPSKGSSTREMTLTPSAGDLYFWVTDASGEDLMDVKKFTVTQSTDPKLVLVGKESNATTDDYELEKAYYVSDKVKGLRVNDDKAVFTYKVRNDGGTYNAEISVMVIAYDEKQSPVYLFPKVKRRIKNDETITFTIEARPEDYGGNRSFFCTVRDGNVSLDVSGFPLTNLYLADQPNSYYTLEYGALFVYVAGAPTGISSVTTSDTSVSGGKGEILIVSDKAQSFNIYNLNGQMVKKASVKAGEQKAVPVPAGLYIVNGKKIIVK